MLPQQKGYCLASHNALTRGLRMLLVEAGPTKIWLQQQPNTAVTPLSVGEQISLWRPECWGSLV